MDRTMPQPTQANSEMSGQELHPIHDAYAYFREYARQRPDVVALWCLGVGFVLGWKLKPW
jgi:hypothetical protein